MNTYLQPLEDGLSIRVFGPWVAQKLDYLARYIDIFETSMRDRPWRKRYYIDLFAGSGKCRTSENGQILLGSPLLALTTSYPFTDFFLVDSDPDNVNTLKKRCQSSTLFDHIHFEVGDGNNLVRRIVQTIQDTDKEFLSGKWSSLNLAFLDPDGLELQWETIVTLAKPSRMDLIIHYSQMGLNRTMPQCFNSEDETIVDRFFGDWAWRQIFKKYVDKEESFLHRNLMDHYKGKLKDLGYKEAYRDDEVGDEPLIRNAKTNAPLYRLLFASKHELGQKFWHQVTRKNANGQRRLF